MMYSGQLLFFFLFLKEAITTVFFSLSGESALSVRFVSSQGFVKPLLCWHFLPLPTPHAMPTCCSSPVRSEQFDMVYMPCFCQTALFHTASQAGFNSAIWGRALPWERVARYIFLTVLLIWQLSLLACVLCASFLRAKLAESIHYVVQLYRNNTLANAFCLKLCKNVVGVM